MIKAAKSDCNIEEQKRIINKLGRLTEEELAFLRPNLSNPWTYVRSLAKFHPDWKTRFMRFL